MAVLDGAIANVALPTIARQLQIDTVASIWVVNAYQLAIVMTLLPCSALGEKIGYRRVYVLGLAIFVAASLGCAAARGLGVLIVARMVQGIGAAGMIAMSTALVRLIYPRALLGRGIGFNGMVVALSAVSGPSLATLILSVADWPWLFTVNLPFGFAALSASLRLPTAGERHGAFDWTSIGLNAVVFRLLITGIDGLAHGRPAGMVLLQMIAALAAGIALVRRNRARPAPLLPVDLFRLPVFALAIAASVLAYTAQMLAYVSIPFFLYDGLQRSQLETGLLMTAWPLTLAVVAPFAGRLADRFASGLLGGTGLVLLAVGLCLLARLAPQPGNAEIAWPMALCGLGFALFQAPNNHAIILAAPLSRSGAASGMLGMARVLGQSLGAALVALAFAAFSRSGAAVSLATGAGFALLAAALSILRRPPSPGSV